MIFNSLNRRNRGPLRALAACVALLAGASLVSAQVVTTGTVVVVVRDTSGGVLPGVSVTASAGDVATQRTAVTNAQGEALLLNLSPSAQYVIVAELAGFRNWKNEKILVRSGQTTTLQASLGLSSMTEQVTVNAETPLVDVTSAVVGQDITLDLTESLPTGRSYQSYLQLVPGVMPSETGNPASKSGINYADIAGATGQSSDNAYYLDGINVTDPVTGTFGANLNTEIIQEQKVLTGGIPAEFVGVPGLISNVITKTGTNAWHGSANYFFQNDGLVSKNKNSSAAKFDTYDSAATIGGPDPQGPRLVLRELPPRRAQRRRHHPRHQPAPALGPQHPGSGLLPRPPGRRPATTP